jgi:3D (Asp-Asp-Asp) domain-containing protein
VGAGEETLRISFGTFPHSLRDTEQRAHSMHFHGVSMSARIPSVRNAANALLILSGIVLAGCSNERRLTVTATAFNSTRAQTDSNPSETACGTDLRPGSRVIAVSRDLKDQGLVCGTKVEVSGLEGTWVVGDVTARRHKQLIDIYMGRDIKAAKRWGVKEVEITWEPDRESRARVRLAEKSNRSRTDDR